MRVCLGSFVLLLCTFWVLCALFFIYIKFVFYRSKKNISVVLCKGKRQCAYPIFSFCSYDHLSSRSYYFIVSLDYISLPNKVSETLAHPGWRCAMIEEMNALTDNDTWDLVCLPVGKKVIGCRWVFTMKVNPNGSIARLKAFLVAKGYA